MAVSADGGSASGQSGDGGIRPDAVTGDRDRRDRADRNNGQHPHQGPCLLARTTSGAGPSDKKGAESGCEAWSRNSGHGPGEDRRCHTEGYHQHGREIGVIAGPTSGPDRLILHRWRPLVDGPKSIRYAYYIYRAIRTQCVSMQDCRDDETTTILRGVLRRGRRLRAARPADGELTPAGIGLMSTLSRLGPMPAARLAEEEGLQPQSLSRLIAGLERAECIRRERNAADRREILIALTDRGSGLLSAEMAARRHWLKRAMASLTAAERQTLIDAAAIMLRLAREEEEPTSPR